MAQGAFKTGMNFKGIMWGMGFVGLALVAGYGAATGWQLRIGRIPLPSWALWIVAVLALLVAIAFVVMSVKATFCATCNVATEGGDAYLPLESEDQVMKAAKSGDFRSLLSLPMVPKDQMKMAIWASYCPKCEQAATVLVTRWKDHAPTTVMEMTEFTGASAEAVAELVQKHEAWREDENTQDE
jgi:hypothetical protein